MSTKPPKVLIAGAGIGGLVAALSLLQRGIDVEIFEQAAELRELGAGVQLSANGTRVLIALGLEQAMQGDRLRAVRQADPAVQYRADLEAVRPRRRPRARSTARRTGWCIAAIFIACCVDAFNARAPGRLHLDSRCVGFDEDGGDGIRLRAREWRTASRRRGGRRRWRSLRNPPADRRRREAVLRRRGGLARPGADGSSAADIQRDVGTNWVGPGGHVITYPVRRGELLNFVGIFEGESWPVESWTERGTREACSRSFAGWNRRNPHHHRKHRHALQMGAARARSARSLRRRAAPA